MAQAKDGKEGGWAQEKVEALQDVMDTAREHLEGNDIMSSHGAATDTSRSLLDRLSRELTVTGHIPVSDFDQLGMAFATLIERWQAPRKKGQPGGTMGGGLVGGGRQEETKGAEAVLEVAAVKRRALFGNNRSLSSVTVRSLGGGKGGDEVGSGRERGGGGGDVGSNGTHGTHGRRGEQHRRRSMHSGGGHHMSKEKRRRLSALRAMGGESFNYQLRYGKVAASIYVLSHHCAVQLRPF